MNVSTYTTFDSELKRQWVDGLNNGGNHELLLFVRAISPFKTIYAITLLDIYHEGFLLSIQEDVNGLPIDYFHSFGKHVEEPMAFFIKIYSDFFQRNTPDLKNNRKLIVLDRQKITSSFIRLRLAYKDALPNNIKPAFITVLSIGEDLSRAYTYRKVNTEQQYIEVDFFTHGVTPTKKWLECLEPGQDVISLREKNESVDHLQQGKVLLCGDETAFPAIASLLDNWQNPEPPLVLLEMLNLEDSVYFKDCRLPKGTQICTFSIQSPDEYGTKIKNYLEQTDYSIQKIWGAFHTDGMKLLRKFFEQKYQITSADMVVRAYWNRLKN